MKNLFLLLTVCLGTIDLPAQTPPMLPLPKFIMGTTGTVATENHAHFITNIIAVPCFQLRYYGITHDGKIISAGEFCSLDPNRQRWEDHPIDQHGRFRFVLRVISNDPPVVIQQSPENVQISGAPAPSASIQTWTTDPNLVLTILPSKCTCAFSNVIGVSFLTVTGKLYECQASDDGSKTWLGDGKIVGDGLRHTNLQNMFSHSRLFRVSETIQ